VLHAGWGPVHDRRAMLFRSVRGRRVRARVDPTNRRPPRRARNAWQRSKLETGGSV
jgi:hypothetical protein